MIYIFTAILLVLSGIFALLVQAWAGFTYFVLTMLMLLALLWAGYLIYQYFTSYKTELKEDFKLFKAETINEKNISDAEFENNISLYEKQFKHSILKDKLIYLFKILFCFAIAVLFITAMIIL